jgi:uncharacterized protein (TIGR04255 family)
MMQPLTPGGSSVPLALARQPRRLYAKNPIKLVVCQLRFPLLADFEHAGFLGPVQAGFAARYPRVRQEQQVGMTIGPQGIAQTQQASIWRFQELDGPWTVALGRDFIALETQTYRRFEDLHERLAEMLDVLDQIGVQVRERIGLRYINRLSHPQARNASDWRPFLRAELLGVVGGPELGDDVVQAVQQIHLLEPDATVVINHGYLSDKAAGDDGAHYLVDIDFFDPQPARLDRAGVLSLVDAYHQRLKDLFEMSITDEMRAHLTVEEELRA